MGAGRVVAAAVLVACFLTLYFLGVYVGIVEPGPMEPLYRIVEPFFEKVLGSGRGGFSQSSSSEAMRHVKVVFEPLLPRDVAASAVVVLPDGQVDRPRGRVVYNVTIPGEGGWLCWNTTAVRWGYREYVPVNASGCILLRNDTVVRIAYRVARVFCVGTDVNVTVEAKWRDLGNGSGGVVNVSPRYECFTSPGDIVVEAPLEVPINSTYSWWLEWYWVKPNGSEEQGYWWSPVLNGSELRLSAGGVVILHYYPGFKALPYVYAVYGFPREWFLGETSTLRGGPPFEVSVSGGWVRLHDPRPFNLTYRVGRRRYEWGFNGPGKAYLYSVLLELDPAVRVAVVEVRVPAWRQNQSRSLRLQRFSVLRPGFATYNVSLCGLWDYNDTYWDFNFTLNLEPRPGEKCPVYIGGYGSFTGKWVVADDAALIVRGRAPYFLVFFAPQSRRHLLHYMLYDFTPLYNSSYVVNLVELRVVAVHP